MTGRAGAISFFLILVVALAIRLSTWNSVFTEAGRVFDGPDAYYHLHRAEQAAEHWPSVPQIDPYLNAPEGGVISWPPLFDGLLATLVLPFKDRRAALELAGALLPPVLGLLQVVVLFTIVRRIASTRAALAAGAVAAILPAVVRYTMVGTLDHDPFFELSVLVALSGITRAAVSARTSVAAYAEVILGCTAAVLSWGGSALGLAWIGGVASAAAFYSRPGRIAIGSTLSLGAAATALLVLPFILRSAWLAVSPFTFEGLSLLHQTALVGLALLGSAMALVKTGERRSVPLAIAVASLVTLMFLLPRSVVAFVTGARYAAGDSPILELVAEGRPLLFLLGPFDLKPMLIRLGLLPIVALIFIPRWIARPEKKLSGLIVGAWVGLTLPVALLHSRFSFSAAIALSAFAGCAFDDLLQQVGRRRAAAWVAALLVLVPVVAAYISIPGWTSQHLYSRVNPIVTFEMLPVLSALHAREPGNVLSPWYFGHWIVWIAERPVVISPMLTVGQSKFREGMRFFFVEDPDEVRSILRRDKVRYLVITPELNTVETRARISGVDPARYVVRDAGSGEALINLRAYLATIAGRLALWGSHELHAFGTTYPAVSGVREVIRSSSTVNGPLGPIPLVRVYEVDRPAAGVAAKD